MTSFQCDEERALICIRIGQKQSVLFIVHGGPPRSKDATQLVEELHVTGSAETTTDGEGAKDGVDQ